MGWSITLPEFRNKGIGGQLKYALLSKINPYEIYATIRIDNLVAISGIKKFGFEPIGKPYMGRTAMISIFAKQN